MDLTNEDVTDILALLDSLPYDELDLQTPRFRLTLRRTADGWTQSTDTRVAPAVVDAVPAAGAPAAATAATDDAGHGATEADASLVAVRAPLPGTFYRAPRPGTAPFVEVGSQVGADTVVGIVETMKLFTSVTAGVSGMVAEICLGNAEFAGRGATLLRIRAD
jgi:acetyl-CoA carboxylase biotin carboxyl carrier protein